MIFNSLEFLLFFPMVLLLTSAVYRKERWRDLTLLLISYLFYMAWYWEYAGLIAFSTFVDYFAARKMASSESPAHRRRWLVISLVVNLGVLALFKYFNFFAGLSVDVIHWFGWSISLPRSELLLPVGISFYTFQSMSYTIDVYRQRIPVEHNFNKFALYVSFFPQLVAGPIVRAADFLPQLRRPVLVTREQFDRGLALIFIGLFKKVIIADTLAVLAVDAVFANPSSYSSVDLMLGLYAYAFQIYGDFSGYSDMAIGAAAMLGFTLPINFNRPYLALNIRDFWTRWHISLSSWLKDYLYISLGGSRGGKWLTMRNLMITMLLGGLWHGAAINFILWGGYHGVLLALSRQQDRHAESDGFWLTWSKRILTFHLVCFGWLMFRAESWPDFVDYVQGLLAMSGGSVLHHYVPMIIALAAAMHVLPKQTLNASLLTALPRWTQAGLYSMALLVAVGFTLDAPAFIYFQF